MLTAISLQNFKCYKDKTKFPLSKLNLLTGLNGKGKSTVLQALLLMKQSIEKQSNTSELYLVGDYIDLNTFQEVRNKFSTSEEIVITFEFSEYVYAYHLKPSTKNGKNTAMIYKLNVDEIGERKDFFEGLIPILPENHFSLHLDRSPYQNLNYISAARINPENSYSLKSLKPTGGHTLKPTVGGFYWQEDVSKYLQEIFEENISVEISDIDGDPIIIRFRLNEKKYLPTNIGFGYTYILPIIIAGVTAEPNEILIIENPEAHLHPRAQSRLTNFLAKVASMGVQVFIESHSDHILNALRVAVKKEELASDDVQIFYFANDTESSQPKIFMPKIDTDGRIEEWPDGFFDEWNNNLMELL